MRRAKTAAEYFSQYGPWKRELALLRKAVKPLGLKEEVKWGAPCYTQDGANIIGIGAFKSYFGVWFFQGALLKDAKGVLVNAQEGVTKAMRQWRMTSADEIDAKLIKQYVEEAAKLAKAGKKVEIAKKGPPVIPTELKSALAADSAASKAFGALTEGRRREYADHITSAKQTATKQKRIEKILPLIKSGAGLNDQYRNC